MVLRNEHCKSGAANPHGDRSEMGFSPKSYVSFKAPDLSTTGFYLYFRELNDVMT